MSCKNPEIYLESKTSLSTEEIDHVAAIYDCTKTSRSWNCCNPYVDQCANIEKIADSKSRGTVHIGCNGSSLPPHIIDLIFDELDILDRCCLALCSKSLLHHALSNEHLDYLLECPPSRRALQDFFERRLGQGWISAELRYCPCCGNFASTSSVVWRLVSEKLTRERSGSVADLWRSRRDDGWLRYWIERWCNNTTNGNDIAASTIRRADKTRLFCPKCAILDSESNIWRRTISGKSTQRS